MKRKNLIHKLKKAGWEISSGSKHDMAKRAGPLTPDNILVFLMKSYSYMNFGGLPLTWSLYGHGFMPWGMAKKGIPVTGYHAHLSTSMVRIAKPYYI